MAPAKKVQKVTAQKKWGLGVDKKIPLFSVYGEGSEEGLALLKEIAEGIVSQEMQLVLTEPKNADYAEFFNALEKKHPNQIKVVDDGAENKKRLLAVSDVVFFFGKDKKKVNEIWKAQAIPVAFAKELVENFDPVVEKGNAFVYKEGNYWSLFAATVRAIETYRFSYDWNNIVLAGKTSSK